MTALLVALLVANVGRVIATTDPPMALVRVPTTTDLTPPEICSTCSGGRTSAATYEDESGTVFNTAAGRLRNIAEDGILIERESVNRQLNSGVICTGLDTTSAGWSLGWGNCNTSAVTAPDPAQTWTTITGNVNGTTIASSPQLNAVGLTRATVSAWVRANSGTQVFTIELATSAINDGTCSCVRSDGTTCTASRSTNGCRAVTAVGVTPVRVAAGLHRPDFTFTLLQLAITAGDRTTLTGFGTGLVWGAQAQAGPLTSYVPTGATVTTRTADSLAMGVSGTVWPAGLGKWCVRATYKPYGGEPWGAVDRALWSVGSGDNSADQRTQTDGTIYLRHRDGANVEASHAATHGMAPVPMVPRGNGITVDGRNILQTLGQAAAGVQLSGTLAGAGTRTWGADPLTVNIGSLATPGTEFNGYIRDFTIRPSECF